jgi:hypothetical protein
VQEVLPAKGAKYLVPLEVVRAGTTTGSLPIGAQKARYTMPGPIHGRCVPGKARVWASGNKTTPCKANSRQKNVQRYFRPALCGRSARGRPWPVRFVHLTSRELTAQLVVQELDQLMGTVLEGPTKAMAAM